MRCTVLSGGVGGATFLRGLRRVPEVEITVVANTADDLWMHGLKICPDLDTVMYTLGGGIDTERGWGRTDESWRVKEELAAYGVEPTWFGLGDRDLATHLVRTQMVEAGYPLSAVTAALCRRWQPGVTLLPMTDDRVETHVLIDDDGEPSGRRAVHFQEYWVRLRAQVPARGVVPVGLDRATPAPGVLEAITEADVVVLPPSNPVVSLGTVLGVAGVSEALRTGPAPVVGLSPIVAGRHVRGMAEQLMTGLGIEVSAAGVAAHYGARSAGGVLDAWLVDSADADAVERVETGGVSCRAVPLMMTDDAATEAMARAALALVGR
ncbi:2-phospho-L-lactate transferase [Nocardioides sp. HDW12B]|uniref:2-phospho-L-lactate transferase n=1 Tax=Nocardioides sp. HDW12B TaxID=2714939 RepID=UPI00140B6C02|nr:2-phospho-L-lactate transferase [Nocardioides sp. HDW12B]